MAVDNLFENPPSWTQVDITNQLRTCGEDPDLAGRLRGYRWDLVYDPAARCTHLRHDNLKSILDMYWRWWKFGNQAYPMGVTLRSWLGHALFVSFRYHFPCASKSRSLRWPARSVGDGFSCTGLYAISGFPSLEKWHSKTYPQRS